MSALQHRWTSLDAACILVSSHTLMKIACDDWPTSAVCGHMGACTQLLMREPHTHQVFTGMCLQGFGLKARGLEIVLLFSQPRVADFVDPCPSNHDCLLFVVWSW